VTFESQAWSEIDQLRARGEPWLGLATALRAAAEHHDVEAARLHAQAILRLHEERKDPADWGDLPIGALLRRLAESGE
jgi:hypothetical protein